uniref:Uncharacterized protein n=1 Tax=Amorphochlora amoebiformis TaxID=1561963 RepID=A0A7S0CU93_9EUKA
MSGKEKKGGGRFKFSAEAAAKIGLHNLATSIEKNVREEKAILHEIEQTSHHIKTVEANIKKMKIHQCSLVLLKEFSIKCKTAKEAINTQHFIRAGMSLSEARNLLSKLENTSLENSRILRKITKRLEKLQLKVSEGLEQAAIQTMFMAQNDSNDVSFVSQKQYKTQGFIVIYTLRLYGPRPTAMQKVITSAKSIGESMLYRCLSHIAKRITKDLITPLLTAVALSPSPSPLPPLPRGISSITGFSVSNSPGDLVEISQRSESRDSKRKSRDSKGKKGKVRQRVWRVVEDGKDLILAIYEQETSGESPRISGNSPKISGESKRISAETPESLQESSGDLIRRFCRDCGKLLVKAVGGGVGEDVNFRREIGTRVYGTLQYQFIKKVLSKHIPSEVKKLRDFTLRTRKDIQKLEKYLLDRNILFPDGKTSIDAARFRLEKVIKEWLSGIEIGGREERRYDPTDLLNFALAHKLEGEKPDEIYRKYVENQTNQGSKSALTHTEVTDKKFSKILRKSPEISEKFPENFLEFFEKIPEMHLRRASTALLETARRYMETLRDDVVTVEYRPNINNKENIENEEIDFATESIRIMFGDISAYSSNVRAKVSVCAYAILQLAYMSHNQAIQANHITTTKFSKAFLDITTDIFSLFTSLCLASLSRGQYIDFIPQLCKDIRFIGTHASGLQFRSRSLLTNTKGTRLADISNLCHEMSRRVTASYLIQKRNKVITALEPINQGVGDLQIVSRAEACIQGLRNAISECKTVVTAEWMHPSEKTENSILLTSYLGHVYSTLVRSIFSAQSISQECARNICILLQITFEVKVKSSEIFDKARVIYRVLGDNITLSLLEEDIKKGICDPLTKSEIKTLVKAIWGKTPKRDALLATLSD